MAPTVTDNTAATRRWEDDEDSCYYCTLFPVFCVVDVPPSILDHFIEEAKTECHPSDGLALCVVTPEDGGLDAEAYRHATRTPTRAFSTPFASASIADLRKLFNEHFSASESFSMDCFAVLDARSLVDNTALLISTYPNEEEDLLTTQVLNHRCEFAVTLHLLRNYDHKLIGIDNHPVGSKTWDWVHTLEKYQNLWLPTRTNSPPKHKREDWPEGYFED